MLHCLCRLFERCVRAEDTDKFFCRRVLGAEPLDGFAIKGFNLIEPLGRLEDLLEIRKILIVNFLKQLPLYFQLIFPVELWTLR